MNLKQLIFITPLLSANIATAQTDTRPNIVILFADDLGYSDVGCYGGEIKTPNIDKLAQQGIRFTHFMNESKCAPSRASLLTGLYATETGCNGEPTQMANGITIAELLKKAGYRTLMTGKWHADEHPAMRGFDRYFGSVNGAFDYFKPKPNQAYMVDTQKYTPYIPENPNSFYTTDVFTEKSIGFLDEYKHENKPFLLYVAYNAPHWPLQAWPEDVAKYRGTYTKGWDEIRKERFARQQKMGLVKPDWKLSDRDEAVESWNNFQRKDDADLTMATYAAMVDRLDQNIGKILAKLDEIGATENTLVLFLSDNGACAEGAMWNGKDTGTKPGTKTSQAKLGVEWANACNTPFRKFKRYLYNGGQVTPFIARWPKEIALKGSITFEPAHLVDLMPTFAELAKVKYPEGELWKAPEKKGFQSEWKIQPLDGKSLLPIFENKPSEKREHFLGYFQGGRMIMSGSWKLVTTGGDGTIQHLYDFPWELYNLKNDGTETNNLAGQYPAMVDSLDGVFRVWMDKTDKLTGISKHPWFPPRLTKAQEIAANSLAKDQYMQTLLAKRREIGLAIVDEISKQKIKLKTTGLGMDKVPMSYFGLVNEGRAFSNSSELLKNLYLYWDKNIEESRRHCADKGSIYLEVWEIQERIRPKTPAYETNPEASRRDTYSRECGIKKQLIHV